MEQGNPRRSTFTAHRMLIKLTETKRSCPRGSARTYSTICASKEPECKESVKRVEIIRGVKNIVKKKKKQKKKKISNSVFIDIFIKEFGLRDSRRIKMFYNLVISFLFVVTSNVDFLTKK